MKRIFLLFIALVLCCQFLALSSAQTAPETSEMEINSRKFILDDTTHQIVEELKHALSSAQEVELAENYILIAAQLRELYNSIPTEMQEQEVIELREQILTFISFFTRRSDHPGADMLKSTLIHSATERLNETTEQPEKSEEADSQWITVALNIANTAMNIASDIGTYHEKISKVGNFISNQVSNTLDKIGLKSASGWAKNLGNGITKFSNEKIAPIEKKVAAKIAPVVKSAPFQAVRRTLNVVTGVMSLKSGLNLLGMAKNVKLPKSFSALKSSIKSTTKVAKSIIKNKQARQRFGRIAKLTGKRAYRAFKKADLKTKYKSIKSIYGGVKSIKGGLTFKRGERKNRQSQRNSNSRRTGKYIGNRRTRSYERNPSHRYNGNSRRSNGNRGNRSGRRSNGQGRSNVSNRGSSGRGRSFSGRSRSFNGGRRLGRQSPYGNRSRSNGISRRSASGNRGSSRTRSYNGGVRSRSYGGNRSRSGGNRGRR